MKYSSLVTDKVTEFYRNRLFDKNNEQYEKTQKIYKIIPEIKDIDAKLSSLGISLTKVVMNGGDSADAIGKLKEESMKLNMRRCELLVEKGYPVDYLDIKYECSVCNDEGVVNGRRCECFINKLKEEAFKSANLPVIMDSQSFETFNLDYYPDDDGDPSSKEIMSYVLKICRNYTENFNESSKNLLFTGGTGLGKTFLSSCIAKELIGKGVSVYYQPAYKIFPLFEQIKFNEEFDENAKMQIDFIRNFDLLIIDDLGTELVTTYTAEVLFDLINTRFNENKKTIISTNLSLTELKDIYSERVSSRIIGNYLMLKFAGNDIRLM